MTASDKLRQMVSEATPGPWRVILPGWTGKDRWRWRCIAFDRKREYTTSALEPTDARLIVLAPQLAALVADMGEALKEYAATDEDPRWVPDNKRNRVLLTRLNALFEKETA